jgi:hypothetical protein
MSSQAPWYGCISRISRWHNERTKRQRDFHTDVDAGDILSLFTMMLSKTGGQQYLTSFWSVYNDLAQHNPEVLQVLASDWRYEMKKQ